MGLAAVGGQALRRVDLEDLRGVSEAGGGRLEPPFASIDHAQETIGGDCDVFVDGDLLLSSRRVVLPSQLRRLLVEARYPKERRASGMRARQRTFGRMPRVSVRQDYCRACAICRTDPEMSHALESWASVAEGLYADLMPKRHAEHKRVIQEEVLPEWRIGDTCYTSGIVNKNSPLAYHRDGGNFAGLWAAMIVLRERAAGGELVLPQLGLAHACEDSTLIIFDNQKLWHGVAPIKTRGGYRVSVVYYSLRGMALCLPQKQEIQRIRKRRAAIESKPRKR